MRHPLLLLASVFIGAIQAAPVSAAKGPFSDVEWEQWAWEAIDILEDDGVIRGYPDGEFKGNRAVTRYELALVLARWIENQDREWSELVDQWDLTTDADYNTLKTLYDHLLAECGEELTSLDATWGMQAGRVDELDERVTRLEVIAETIEWTGSFRVRAEDYITGQPDESSAHFEHQLYLYASAQPSDYLEVSTGVYVYTDDLTTEENDNGAFRFGGQQPILDHMTADADLVQLLGYDEGVDDWLTDFHAIVGRQYAQFGTYGLTFENSYESRPGITLDGAGPHWGANLFLARDVNADSGEQEGLGAMRLSYGWGAPPADSERTDAVRVGVNYLWNGVGAENGLGADLDAQFCDGPWFPTARAEYLHLNEDQSGADVDDAYDGDVGHSLIAGTDVYNDGTLVVNARYGSVGITPGYSSADNDPFVEYDFLEQLGGNVAINAEVGLNYFPSDFEGFGVGIEYTWFETYYMNLTIYDGQRKSDDADLPVTARLLGRYPLSDESSLAIEYIHQGIDAPTVGLLRGEFLVEF